MDVHEMLAVVVSDTGSARVRRTSTDIDRTATPTPTSHDAAATTSPFAVAARHSLDMGPTTAPVSIPRHSLDLPKSGTGTGAYSLSRMFSGSIFPGSLSRTSTATYPSRGSPSPPLSPASTFGGRMYNTFNTGECSTSWASDKANAMPDLAQPKAKHMGEAGGLARCLAGLSHMEPMYHMDHLDVEHERHST